MELEVSGLSLLKMISRNINLAIGSYLDQYKEYYNPPHSRVGLRQQSCEAAMDDGFVETELGPAKVQSHNWTFDLLVESVSF